MPRLRFYASVLIGLLLNTSLWAQDKAAFEIQFLADTSGQISWSEIQNHSIAEAKWQAQGFDKSTAVYWLRVKIKSGLEPGRYIFKAKYIDTLRLYIPDSGASYQSYLTGENIPHAQRPIRLYEHLGVALDLQEQAQTLYARAHSVSDYSLYFRSRAQFQLIPEASFEAQAVEARYYHGIFLGILLALMIYNLIIYGIYRDRGYAIYALFMLSQALYHLSITGYLGEFIFSQIPQIGKHSPYTIAALSLICFIYFSQVFLNSRSLAPKLHQALNYLLVFILLTNIVGYFYRLDIANSIMLLQGVVMNVLAFAAAIVASRKNYAPARYFLIASVLAFSAYTVFVMARFELLPDMALTRYAFQISIALQSLLYAIGIADRMRLVLRELAEKKLEKERLEKEQERKLRDILQSQNEELELKVAERTKEIQSAQAQLEEQFDLLAQEKQKSEKLILNILPQKVAQELKDQGYSKAQLLPEATVLFTDFQGFTSLSAQMAPQDLVEDLHHCFSAFDQICEDHGIEKIKTIGDAYMAAGGIPKTFKGHVSETIQAALKMRDFISAGKASQMAAALPFFEIRIGVHTGPVIAGIVGLKKFQYDIWGDTVNTASRMESSGAVGKVNISESTYQKVKDDPRFQFESRGSIAVKGKGEMPLYFVDWKQD